MLTGERRSSRVGQLSTQPSAAYPSVPDKPPSVRPFPKLVKPTMRAAWLQSFPEVVADSPRRCEVEPACRTAPAFYNNLRLLLLREPDASELDGRHCMHFRPRWIKTLPPVDIHRGSGTRKSTPRLHGRCGSLAARGGNKSGRSKGIEPAPRRWAHRRAG